MNRFYLMFPELGYTNDLLVSINALLLSSVPPLAVIGYPDVIPGVDVIG